MAVVQTITMTKVTGGSGAVAATGVERYCLSKMWVRAAIGVSFQVRYVPDKSFQILSFKMSGGCSVVWHQ